METNSKPTKLPGKPSVCIISHDAYGAMCGGASGSIGGVQLQTSLAAKWLAQRGYCTSMLTWHEGGPHEEIIDGVRVIKVCRQNAGLKGLRFFHPKWTGLIKAMRLADADVYYHNCSECATGQIALWCRANGRAFVFSAASDADSDPALPELRSRHERILYRYGLRRADRVIVQTMAQQRRMKGAFGVEAQVIPMPCPGPNDAQFSPPDPKANRVLWIGRVCKVKRPDRLLDLAEQYPEAVFDMVGPFYEDDYSEGIRQRASRIANVTVHGPVPRDRVNEFYRRAALLCCTSDYEGFPNTFLEAWSHGLPIVSTVDPDGLIAERGLGIVARNVHEMQHAVLALLQDQSRYWEISRNARRYYLENHRIEAVLPRFEDVFRKALASRSGPQAITARLEKGFVPR